MFYPKHMRGTVKGWEYLPAGAGAYQAGQLLNVVDGKLAAISAASKTTPGYLCMADTTVADGENLPVQKIDHDTIYVTTLSAAAAYAKIGSKLEVSAGGLQADGAAAGTFALEYLEGTDAGCEVHGRFQ